MSNTKSVKVLTAVISHRHGTGGFVAFSMAELKDRVLTEWCEAWYEQELNEKQRKEYERLRDAGDTHEAITYYFDCVHDESIEYGGDTYEPFSIYEHEEGDIRNYADEATVRLWWGGTLRFPSHPRTVDYVRVCNTKGEEIAYWISDEWEEDGKDVMGAILGAMMYASEEEIMASDAVRKPTEG